MQAVFIPLTPFKGGKASYLCQEYRVTSLKREKLRTNAKNTASPPSKGENLRTYTKKIASAHQRGKALCLALEYSSSNKQAASGKHARTPL